MNPADSRKHPCPDCAHCQWCGDDRCRLCVGTATCRSRKKLTIAEQIARYEERNRIDADRRREEQPQPVPPEKTGKN